MKKTISLLLSITMLLSIIAGIDLSSYAVSDWVAVASSDFSAVQKTVNNGSLGEVPRYENRGNPLSWSVVSWSGNGNVEKESDALYVPDGYMYISGYSKNGNSGLPIKGAAAFKIDFEFRYKDINFDDGSHSSDNVNYSNGYTFMKIGADNNVLTDCASEMYSNAVFTQDAFGPCGTMNFKWQDGKPISTYNKSISAGKNYHYIFEYTGDYAKAYVTDDKGNVVQEEFNTDDKKALNQIRVMLRNASYLKIGDNRQTAYLRALEYKNITFYTAGQSTNEEGEVLTINNLSELEAFRDRVNSGDSFFGATVKLNSDIVLNKKDVFEFDENGFVVDVANGAQPYVWTPIGTEENPFEGEFDGAGHEIKGIYINEPAGYQGLFGHCLNSSIKNITTGYGIIIDGRYTGSVVGYFENCCSSVTISGCNSKTTLKAVKHHNSDCHMCTGGVIGTTINYGTDSVVRVENCKNYSPAYIEYSAESDPYYNTYTVSWRYGGIIGESQNEDGETTITNCVNYGTMKATYGKATSTSGSSNLKYLGGIEGRIYCISGELTVTECENKGELIIKNFNPALGGITGICEESAVVSACANSGIISGDNSSKKGFGGIAGINSGTVEECLNSGNIRGYDFIGGIAGVNNKTIENCYNSGEINGSTNAGGIAGQNIGEISYCYNSGAITAYTYPGGIVGTNGSTSYYSYKYGSIKNCYYYETTAAQECANNPGGSIETVLSLTYDEMQSYENFEGFDFDNVWGYIISDYLFPILQKMMFVYGDVGETDSYTVSVTDENNSPIKSGYTVNWYEKGSNEIISSGNTLAGLDKEKKYQYQIVLDESLSYVFKQPQIADVVIDGVSRKCTVKLEKIKSVRVSGRIKDSQGNAISEANIFVTQTFNSKYEKKNEYEADSNGNFSFEAADVVTKAVFTANGYYSVTRIIIDKGNNNSEIILDDIVLLKLPENKITVTLSKVYAAYNNQEKTTAPINNANGISFTLYNKTKEKAITKFSVEFPYIIIEDGEADANDEIRISAADGKNEMTAEDAELKLDSRKMGSCNIEFVENGKFSIKSLTGCESCTEMIFDSEGRFISSSDASENTLSNTLPEGNYSVLFIQKTDLFRSVSDISRLADFGLENNVDYTVKEVSIQNGVISEIESVKVPSFDESKLYYTVADKTKFTCNTSSFTVGRYAVVRCEYKIDDKYSSDDETVWIEMPDGIEFANSSLLLDGKLCSYTLDNKTLKVNTKKKEGVIRFYIVPIKTGDYNIDAFLSFKNDASNVIQPIGTVSMDVETAKINVPEKTSEKQLGITGITMANSAVTVYDNNVEVGTTKSNACGSWSLSFELIKPEYTTSHRIIAEIENDNVSQSIVTDSKWIVYDENYCQATKITMINVAHPENSINTEEYVTVFDLLKPSTNVPSYRYWPNYPKFTFKVDFSGNASGLEYVYVVTTDCRNTDTFVKCTYDKATGCWIGTHDYERDFETPEAVSVEFNNGYAQNNKIDDNAATQFKQESHQALSQIDAAEIESFIQNEFEFDITDTEEDGTVLSIDFNSDETEKIFVSNKETTVNNVSDIVDDSYFKGEASDGSIVYTKMVFSEELFGTVTVNAKTKLMETNIIAFNEEALNNVDDVISLAQVVSTSIKLNSPLYAKGPVDYGQLEKLMSDLVWAIKVNDKITGSAKNLIKKIDDIAHAIEKKTFGRHGNLPKILKTIDEWKAVVEYGAEALYAVPKREIALINMIDSSCLSQSEKNKLTGDVRWWASFAPMVSLAKSTLEGFISLAGLFSLLLESFGLEITVFTSEFANEKAMDLCESLIEQFDDMVFGALKTSVNNIFEPYENIPDAIENIVHFACDEPPLKKQKNPPNKTTKIVDPSGYVYEAVPSNRLEGVKAEAYYYDYKLDEFGIPEETKSEILWDAENYDQVNPLYTDKNGEYAWDVPLGQWLVKFSKEGYYDTDSRNDPAVDEEGYLPVPPPQTEVNVAMVSKAAPKVEDVSVYNGEIRIVFSQYMQLDSVSENSVSVKMNGKAVSGKITPLNAEYDYEHNNRYASKFIFVPETSLSGDVNVKVTDVLNYAGTKSTEVFDESYKVVPKPDKIIGKDNVEISYNSGALLEIEVLPAAAGAGKALDVSTSAPSIVGIVNENIVLDENGKANIMLSGNLPGESDITVTISGTDFKKTVKASVADVVEVKNQCEKVTASIKSGTTVNRGTKVELSTATEGAEIYYTLDGTCPCTVDSPSRIKYTKPIEIKEETFIIAYAVKNGFEESYTAGFTYFVKTCDNGKHTSAKAVKENVKNATYDKEGSYDEVVYCSVCGKELSRKTFKVAKLKKTSLSKATVSGIANKTYSGKKQTQKLTVKLGKTTLKSGTDYKVTYKNNTAVGKATVTITGINKYSGTISKTFKINPKGTSLTSVTAKSKGFTAKWKKQTNKTTGYEIQYSTDKNFKKGNKTVTVNKNSTTSKAVSKLKSKKKYYVRIRTYKTVNGTKYYSSWSKSKTVTAK